MVTNRVTRRRRVSPAKSDFGLLVYDPHSCSGPFTMIMEGPWVESWGAEACQEVAGLLGMARWKTTVTEMEHPTGVQIEIPTLVEHVPIHVIAVSVRTDTSLPVSARLKGGFGVAIPACEVENLARVLMGAAKGVSNRKEMPQAKAGAS